MRFLAPLGMTRKKVFSPGFYLADFLSFAGFLPISPNRNCTTIQIIRMPSWNAFTGLPVTLLTPTRRR